MIHVGRSHICHTRVQLLVEHHQTSSHIIAHHRSSPAGPHPCTSLPARDRSRGTSIRAHIVPHLYLHPTTLLCRSCPTPSLPTPGLSALCTCKCCIAHEDADIQHGGSGGDDDSITIFSHSFVETHTPHHHSSTSHSPRPTSTPLSSNTSPRTRYR